MSYYRTCPHCGAHLDPGEVCDCRPCMYSEALQLIMDMTDEQCAEVMEQIKKKAPADAANIDEGRVEKVLEGSDSTSTITENGGFVK